MRKSDCIALAAIALLVVVCYLPAVPGDFVWDDEIFAEEPVIHSASGLRSIWFSPADIKKEGHYWPLVYTTFWLEHKLWGLEPAGYHLVNIFLHLINSLLIGRLMLRLGVPGAWMIAAVFALHPVHVESVAWIIERKDVLSGLFYLTAVLVWLRFDAAPRPWRYALALALYIAGLLSKSVVVTLPAALLILQWWRHGRVTRRDLARMAPFAAVGLAITIADLSFYAARESVELAYTPVERVLIAARALWFYAGKLVWPLDLAIIYPLWDIRAGDPLAWAWLLAALALAAALFLARGKIGRGPLAGALFFAVTLAPVLGFVDYGYMQFSLVADRYQYLAATGILAVLIGAAAHAAGRLPGGARAAAWGLAAVVVVLSGALTWRQAGLYRDEITFFSHIIAHNPQARAAHLNLSSALLDAERADEALAAALVAIQQRAEHGAHLNLSGALLALERPEEALPAALAAVDQRPGDAGALGNAGGALLKMGRLEEAEDFLRRAVERDPRNLTALQNFAEAQRRQGRYEEAVAGFAAVLELDGDTALAHGGMGEALYHLGRNAQALQSMQRALALQPDMQVGPMRLTMAHAARALGRANEAAAYYEQAAANAPDDPEPLIGLAAVRAGQQRAGEAAAYLTRALALRPADALTLHRIAEELRKLSRLEAAFGGYREALAIDPDFAAAHAGMGIALYQSKRYEPAIASMAKALSLDPDLTVAATLHLYIGHSHAALGRPAAANEHYERALAVDPRNTTALDHLAMARFGKQRYREALELYRRMVAITPDSAQTHSNMGAALFHLGRFEEALASTERALELNPDLEVARVGLRQIRRALQERQE